MSEQKVSLRKVHLLEIFYIHVHSMEVHKTEGIVKITTKLMGSLIL